jgi:hypothetical protein
MRAGIAADGRCVLKERRRHPGALTCSAVAECWGWRWGRVHGEGFAGSSLRSLRKLWGVGAFALCERDFCCSLPRLAPARSRCRFVEAQEGSGPISIPIPIPLALGVWGSWGYAERVFVGARVFSRLLPCASFFLGAFRLPSQPVWEPPRGRFRDCETVAPPR